MLPPEPVPFSASRAESHAASLPRPLTRFIGREREIAAVASQLQDGVRVRVLRSSVTGLYPGATTAAKTETKSEAKAS